MVNWKKLKFNRSEIAGGFGDIGTDLPLIVGMIQAINLDSASVLIMFGIMQILAGIFYGFPMPMQPLKAMAVIVITEKVVPEVLSGGAMAIALLMMILTITGSLSYIARIIPLCVVRGIQFGLGLSLSNLALKTYIPSLGFTGYLLAIIAFIVMIFTPKTSLIPAGLIVIALGFIYALWFKLQWQEIIQGIDIALPQPHLPKPSDILTGLFILALPQLPLSIANSVIATQQTVKDLFPEAKTTVKKIGFTYSISNIIMAFFGGIPVCHGCGGLAGHYTLGARTGGSVIIYGLIYLTIGLAFSQVIPQIIAVFPQPILGIVLLFQALTLMLFIKDQSNSKQSLLIALIVALIAFSLPQGYLIGLVVGSILYYSADKISIFQDRNSMNNVQ